MTLRSRSALKACDERENRYGRDEVRGTKYETDGKVKSFADMEGAAGAFYPEGVASDSPGFGES